MELVNAIEMVVFCPRGFVDQEDEGCKVCPLREVDENGTPACDIIRGLGKLLGDYTLG